MTFSKRTRVQNLRLALHFLVLEEQVEVTERNPIIFPQQQLFRIDSFDYARKEPPRQTFVYRRRRQSKMGPFAEILEPHRHSLPPQQRRGQSLQGHKVRRPLLKYFPPKWN